MKFTEVLTPTVRAIYAAREKEGRAEAPRRYLGASIIGHECDRYLWLMFRGVISQKFDGRMFRLFERGRREEAEFCRDLRSIGCEVWEKDENGNQFGVSFLGDHFRGHCDAIVRGIPEAPKTPHVVEMKTHSAKSFANLVKEGVKKSKPMHYAQMQIYMHGLGLEDALYLAVNKDTDDLYTERVKLDKAEAKRLLERAECIIDGYEAMRCATREDDYRCKMCEARMVCWHKTGAEFACETCIDCRSCCHSTPDTTKEGSRWICMKGKNCTIGRDCECENHRVIPVLMAGELMEARGADVVYKDAKGNEVVNGESGYSSKELASLPKDKAGEIANICAKTGGTFVGSNTLEMKFKNAPEVFVGDKAEARAYMQEHGVGKWAETAHETVGGKEYYEYCGTKLVIIDCGKGRISVKDMEVA